MNLKTCLQFDEPADIDGQLQFKPELCCALGDTLIYAEGNFLQSSCEEEFPPFEFDLNISFIKEIALSTKEKFLLILLEDSTLIIIDLKTKKLLTRFANVLPSKIVKIRQSPEGSVYFLTESQVINQIENFILFTRLTQDLFKERYESGQILKAFALDSTIKDFYPLSNSDEMFFTVGNDQMISWWNVANEPKSSQNSIMNYFFSSGKRVDEPVKPPKITLKLSRFLNEPDRSIDKILLFHGNLAVLEDSTHGRLLVLDLEHSLILKIFKGYRDCSATIVDKSLLIWAGNRFTLETWETFPFCQAKSAYQEFPHCTGHIEESNFHLYDPDLFQLKQFVLK